MDDTPVAGRALMVHAPAMLDADRQLEDLGYSPVVLAGGSKKALLTGWTEPLPRRERAWWLRRYACNLGVLVRDGLLITDLDAVDLAWGRERGIESPMVCRTARGFHVYMQHALAGATTKKLEWGDIKATGQCVCPPSTVNGHRYEWLNGIVRRDQLPPAPPFILDVLVREEPGPRPVYVELPEDRRLEGMRRWIRRKVAVEGEGGDAVTYKVAVKIASVVTDFRQAMCELLAWDATNARPPWSETPQGLRALEHKMECAMRYMNARR